MDQDNTALVEQIKQLQERVEYLGRITGIPTGSVPSRGPVPAGLAALPAVSITDVKDGQRPKEDLNLVCINGSQWVHPDSPLALESFSNPQDRGNSIAKFWRLLMPGEKPAFGQAVCRAKDLPTNFDPPSFNTKQASVILDSAGTPYDPAAYKEWAAGLFPNEQPKVEPIIAEPEAEAPKEKAIKKMAKELS